RPRSNGSDGNRRYDGTLYESSSHASKQAVDHLRTVIPRGHYRLQDFRWQIVHYDHDFENRLELVERPSCNIQVSAEFPGPSPRRPLGDVERDAVGSSPPLIGERELLMFWQSLNRRLRQTDECLGFLPRSQ